MMINVENGYIYASYTAWQCVTSTAGFDKNADSLWGLARARATGWGRVLWPGPQSTAWRTSWPCCCGPASWQMFNRPESWYIDVAWLRIFGYGYPFSEKLHHPFPNKHIKHGLDELQSQKASRDFCSKIFGECSDHFSSLSSLHLMKIATSCNIHENPSFHHHLLSSPVQVEQNGWYPLFRAAWSGRSTCAQLLLAAGADVEGPPGAGSRYSPLMCAARWGHLEVRKIPKLPHEYPVISGYSSIHDLFGFVCIHI